MMPTSYNQPAVRRSATPVVAQDIARSYAQGARSRSTESAKRDRWIHVACDGGALIVAWLVTFQIRYWLNTVMPVHLSFPQIVAAAPPLAGMLLLWTITAWWLRIYRKAPTQPVRSNIADLVESVVTMNALAIILIYCSRDFGVGASRSFVPIFALASLPLLIVSVYAADVVISVVEKRWPLARRVAVMGKLPDACEMVDFIKRTTTSDVTIAGIIVPEGSGPLTTSRHPVLGTSSELAEVINRDQIKRIIMAGNCVNEDEFKHYVGITSRMAVTVSCPVTWTASTTVLSLANDYGLQLLDIETASRARGQAVLKRPLDIAISVLLLSLFAPLIALLALLIKVSSPGPVLYRSIRVGRGGKYFTFWKFRSMYYGAKRCSIEPYNEHRGHLFKVRNDPRITPLGRYLRRYSLDELPQLFNVLKGDMSIVGPRPLPIEDLDPDGLSSEFRQWAEERATVKPGLTGLWQISGRSNIPFEQMVQFDVDYVKQWSLLLDIRIILATPVAVLTGRGAY